MWQAVGSCLHKMNRDRDGIKALKRALLADSYYDSTASSFGSGGPGAVDRTSQMDPEVLLQIAKRMYDRLGEEEEAKEYMELCVAQEGDAAAEADGGNLGESIAIHHDSPGGASDEEDGGNRGGGDHEGTGVTIATCKASHVAC